MKTCVQTDTHDTRRRTPIHSPRSRSRTIAFFKKICFCKTNPGSPLRKLPSRFPGFQAPIPGFQTSESQVPSYVHDFDNQAHPNTLPSRPLGRQERETGPTRKKVKMRNEVNPTSGKYVATFEANPAAPNPAYNKPMTGRPPGRLQGDDLIGEVLRNLEEGLFRIRRKTLVPAIYRIYLNPEDYEPFRDVVPFIAGEIRTALDERLATLNREPRSPRKLAFNLLGKLGVGETPPDNEYVRMNDAWVIEIHPDLDGKLQPGEIEVYSELGAPRKAEYGAGSLTRRIFPKQPEPLAEDAAATVATGIPPHTSDQPEPDAGNEDQTKGIAFAYLRYADQHGPQTFDVTKNQVVIGRGGRSYWVDLRLDTLPDVSREHCRIRRDPETGRFTVEDVSQFGTAVNGKPVGRNASADLPTRATISLAGVIDLQWEAA